MKIYTKEEMKQLWLRSLGWETARTDCAVERVDGIDTDALVETRMRQWYLGLLDSAPASMVMTADLTEFIDKDELFTEPLAYIEVPAKCRRVLSVKLSGWMCATAPIDIDSAAKRLVLAKSPFGQPGNSHPLAVALPDGAVLAGPAHGQRVVAMRGVIDPGPDFYTLDEALLATIPSSL